MLLDFKDVMDLKIYGETLLLAPHGQLYLVERMGQFNLVVIIHNLYY
ncbi:hypothetical protein [Neobacillus vireti]